MVSSAAKLVDFHCHLDLYPDFEAVVAECEISEIQTLAVTTTPLAFPRNLELTRSTQNVRAALGLHPQLVADRAKDIEAFPELLGQTRYIGEVGLDASPRFYRSFGDQERIFAHILSLCAEAGGKILTVHSVRAATRVLDHVERSLPPDRGKVVLHWFTGSAQEAKRAVALGCYFSINSQMLLKAAHIATITNVVPMDRLLTETDGPFVQYDGRPVRPKDVNSVLETLARLLRKDVSLLRASIYANLKRLLH